jgi:hypothetical protein
VAPFPDDGVVQTGPAGPLALVRFFNLGNAELTVMSYAIGGADAAAFAIPNGATLPSPECGDASCGTTMPAGCKPVRLDFGGFLVLGLEYIPASAGAHTATFTIVSNASNCPVQVTLSGT